MADNLRPLGVILTVAVFQAEGNEVLETADVDIDISLEFG
jgi:hypothetical protein